jgi:hypothetical protein
VKKDILKESDALLARIDGGLADRAALQRRMRETQDASLAEAVGRLVDSAAQGANGMSLETVEFVESLGLDWQDWHFSVAVSKEGTSRLCNGFCCDEDPDEGTDHLDCGPMSDVEPEADCMGLQSYFFEKRVLRTAWNVSVLNDPPDGVEAGYRGFET